MTRREVPQWVIDHVANPHTDYLPFGSGYVLMRDGVVIDRWPSDEMILRGTSESDLEPVGIFEAFGGFWRDCGNRVEQWVVPR